MTEDERFNEYVGDMAREIDTPPPAPREQMWARIQQQRGGGTLPQQVEAADAPQQPNDEAADAAQQPNDNVIELAPRTRRVTWVQLGAALAAMLVIGVGLGRVSMRQAQPDDVPQASAPVNDDDGVPSPYQLVAAQHLQRTETLLNALPMEVAAGRTAELMTWARDLHDQTRLLLATPAADDPVTKKLLEDLELILSQIAAIPTARAQEEVELIEAGINQSDVRIRVRAATTGRMPVGT